MFQDELYIIINPKNNQNSIEFTQVFFIVGSKFYKSQS